MGKAITRQTTIGTVSIELAAGEELVVGRAKQRKEKVPPYFCLGRLNPTSYDVLKKAYVEGLDVTAIFLQLSGKALKLFWQMIALRNIETNVVSVNDPKLKNSLKKSYGELADFDLIVRIKAGYYLINPKAVFPLFDCYKSVEQRWELLKADVKPRKFKVTTFPLMSLTVDSSYHQDSLDDAVDEAEQSLECLPPYGCMDQPIEYDPSEDEEQDANQRPMTLFGFTLNPKTETA